jgi:hypothetical protein
MQDLVKPYRYTDSQMVDALNVAMEEAQRIRPDIFLDLKYQQPIVNGDLDDGFIQSYYTTSDISLDSGGDYVVSAGTMVPVPSRYNDPLIWYMAGHLQALDVEDTQDARAIAFIAKFLQRLTTPTS